MIGFKKTATVVLLVGLGFAGTTQAMLVDRGNGLLYDNVLDVTWLQDANYAHTSGYAGADSLGRMDWTTATTWAANLNYNGLTGWRLPSTNPVNGNSFNYTAAYDGSTDAGYNITSQNSELAYMYYVNLELKGVSDLAANERSDFGIFGNGTYNGVDRNSHGQNNVGLVNNLQNWVYFSGTEVARDPNSQAWGFAAFYGLQVNQDKVFNQFYAWPVRPGDVAAVPAPDAIWLIGSGLIGLLSFNRSKNKTTNLIAA